MNSLAEPEWTVGGVIEALVRILRDVEVKVRPVVGRRLGELGLVGRVGGEHHHGRLGDRGRDCGGRGQYS